MARIEAVTVRVEITQRELMACRNELDMNMLIRNKCEAAGIPLQLTMIPTITGLKVSHGSLYWCYHTIAETWVIEWSKNERS